MSLQTVVNRGFAKGIEGQPATVDEAHFTAATFISDTAVKVGRFVFRDESAPNEKAAQAGTENSTVLGFVPFIRNFTNPENFTASMEIAANTPFTVAVEGKFWAKAETTAKVGQQVYVRLTDGVILTADVTDTPEGSIDTNFRVVYVDGDGAAGSLIIISNQLAYT